MLSTATSQRLRCFLWNKDPSDALRCTKISDSLSLLSAVKMVQLCQEVGSTDEVGAMITPYHRWFATMGQKASKAC